MIDPDIACIAEWLDARLAELLDEDADRFEPIGILSECKEMRRT